ncbi:uncharacterized protein FIBRA_00484 [Fibroporia radiculosa]|uniref:RING-type domain-containing protein n=1 Tax=Fibroporia radiculosa TaxID=599839 RepID=J4I7Y8_9APHY|nr:uncharacterized protein FIBRA_00484 [Fibroporia radiculosa]CCL98486.1 predicted protein [Fibroporia radiculosa]
MHFSKTYQQLLLTLPVELRDSAIEYRKLKKLINQVVGELNSIGLSPNVLHDALPSGDTDLASLRTIKVNEQEVKVVYELVHSADHIEPRLRLLIDSTLSLKDKVVAGASLSSNSTIHADVPPSSLTEDASLNIPPTVAVENALECTSTVPVHSSLVNAREVIIPLVSDSAFFDLLTQAIQYLSTRLAAVRLDFEANLHTLSHNISYSARPMSSSTSTFRPHSAHTSDAANVSVQGPLPMLFSGVKSDLYAWREIFQLYVEAEIFESCSERTRGERTIEESEARFNDLMQKLQTCGYISGQGFKVKDSREALRTFLHLITFIMDLRKFQHATTEATRKILKKHAKRTALPLTPTIHSPFITSNINTTSLVSILLPSSQQGKLANVFTSDTSISLSLVLGQAIGENILPIIPHIDDYACLICTSIAFKPIRLACGHLFCVRCLVKMQKRNQPHCPMCRASNVLSANRSNVDWALLNFMKDWFPEESRQKLRQNEKEVAEEELEELGIEVGRCAIM